MNELQMNTMLQVLQAQRNAAQDQLVQIIGQLTVANARITELEKELPKKKEK